MLDHAKEIIFDSRDFIRNPAVFDFLDLPANFSYTEKQLDHIMRIKSRQQVIIAYGLLKKNQSSSN